MSAPTSLGSQIPTSARPTAPRRRRRPRDQGRTWRKKARRKNRKSRVRLTLWRLTKPVREDARAAVKWARSASTAVYCGACKPAQRVPRRDIQAHMHMHWIIANTQHRKGERERKRAENRARQREHDQAVKNRPVNPQKPSVPGQHAQNVRDGKQPVSEGGDPRTDTKTGLPVWDGTGVVPKGWRAYGTPPRTPDTRTRPPSNDGKRWKERTSNPGTDNPPGHVPHLHGPTKGTPPVSTEGTNGTKPPPRSGGSGGSTKPRTSRAGTGGPSSGGEVGMTAMANSWASRLPEELNASRGDTDAMANDLHGVGDALRRRAQQEIDRGMPADVMEPLEAAARLLSQAGEQVQEVTVRQETRFRELADQLSKRDTPNAGYLSPENVARGR